MSSRSTTGFILVDAVGGADLPERRQRLAVMAGRAGERLAAAGRVLSAALPPDGSGLAERGRELAAAGVTRIVVAPALPLASDGFARRLRAAADDLRRELVGVEVVLDLPDPDDRRLEDQWVDRFWPFLAGERIQPATGAEIEQQSRGIVDRALDRTIGRLTDDERAVARRIVHATADVTFLDSLRFSAGAVAAGVAAVRARRPVVCDVRMLAAGCTHAAGEVVCAVSEPAVIAAARAGGITRAAAAMQHLGDRIEGAIVAVGNAPTALWALLAVAAAGGPRPALVVGLPVGFVGAYESKRDLSRSALPHITNLSPRGGSPAAAAAVNALADLAKHGE